MKRSKSISLVIIASLLTTTLAACGSSEEGNQAPPPKIFSSLDQCYHKDLANNCEFWFKNAKSNHLISAPRYSTEGECVREGHEKCSDITLDGVTAWLPKMVGFMDSGRPLYLKKLSSDTVTVEVEGDDGSVWEEERTLTPAEMKEREVVAGPVGGNSSVIIVGGWYPTPSYYSHGFSPSRPILTEGMSRSSSRWSGSGGSRGFSTYSGGSRGTSISRGGFGGAGRGGGA